MNVCQDEIDTFFCGPFASAIEVHELNVIACTVVAAPRGIATKFQVDASLNRGSGAARARAEIDEGVGCQGGTEEGAKCRGEG